ncbi:MAG: hypothetical protein AW09_001861 [Candidatus Accumulibacter phosphatis]|uniref:Uncharacterized protein n=1 Tax=Candidatus Accumulibacter phosphatis TaxID=327160 RepID=A0A080LW22_9PROT|nr:MAG: hypothetical protein AW09_001861 [Candidatus Accumulibacter phosphatis]
MVHRRHAADGITIGAVNRGHVGDQGVADIFQFTRQNVHQGDVTALAGAVEGDFLAAVEFHDLGAELARLFAVLVWRERLDLRIVHDVLDDTDIGRDTLVGERVAVTLVLEGQERQDVYPQHVRWHENDWFEILANFNARLQRQYLIELEGVRFMDQLVIRRVEMEAEFIGDGFDLLIEVGDCLHDFGFAAHVAAQLFAFRIEDGVQESARPFFDLVERVVGHLCLHPGQTLAPHGNVVFEDLEGLHHAQRVVTGRGHGDVSGNEEIVIKLADFAIRGAHHGQRIPPPTRGEIRHFP